MEIGKAIDGDDVHEERALGEMLCHDVLFANEGVWRERDRESPTVVLFVNCNDVFAWACADGEEVPFAEVPRLYRMWLADPGWGAAKWCCLRRKMQPQAPVVVAMKADGAWDAEMEALAPNSFDAKAAEGAPAP